MRAAYRIFGYEVDGGDYRMEDDPALVIVAIGLATNVEPSHDVRGKTAYVADADAIFKARVLFGEVTPEILDRSSRGNGAIVHWRRGKREVFATGVCE